MGYLTSVLLRLLEQGPIEERLAKIEATLCQSKVSPARQSLQAAYGSHLRGQVAPRRRAETPATVEHASKTNDLQIMSHNTPTKNQQDKALAPANSGKVLQNPQPPRNQKGGAE